MVKCIFLVNDVRFPFTTSKIYLNLFFIFSIHIISHTFLSCCQEVTPQEHILKKMQERQISLRMFLNYWTFDCGQMCMLLELPYYMQICCWIWVEASPLSCIEISTNLVTRTAPGMAQRTSRSWCLTPARGPSTSTRRTWHLRGRAWQISCLYGGPDGKKGNAEKQCKWFQILW